MATSGPPIVSARQSSLTPEQEAWLVSSLLNEREAAAFLAEARVIIPQVARALSDVARVPKKGELETCKAEIQRAAAILRGVDVRTMIFVDTSLPANCQPERLPWENDGPPYTQAVQMLDGIAAAIDTAIAELGPRRGPSIKKAATSRLLTALTVGLLRSYMRSTGRTPAISEASSDRFASLLAHAFELLGEGRSYVRRYIAEARALIQD